MTFTSPLALLLLQVAVILAISRAMGLLFARFRQPQTIGEIVAGLMLGPSLLGWAWPSASHALFGDAASLGTLGLLAQLGVLLFLFVVGLEFDPEMIRRRGRVAASISVCGIVVPFALGVAVTFPLRHLFPGIADRDFFATALFMGAAMSVTAFPVLARIVSEWNLQKTEEGQLAIAAAAVDDVLAWTLLAVVVAFAPHASGAATHGPGPAGVLGWAAVYVAVMWFAVRPLLAKIYARLTRDDDSTSMAVLAVLVCTMLLSAFATEQIGVHALFGAFVAGLVTPKHAKLIDDVTVRLEGLVLVLLLPIFFAIAGLKVDLRQLLSWDMAGYTALLTAVACVGTLGGTGAAAALSGLPGRQSVMVGILMNTRGLMELIILTVGLQLGVINQTVYGMMVIMALVTTGMAAPLIGLLNRNRAPRAAAVAAA
jgi:Kef-type K+ transport system membrane component KefB